MSVKILPDWRKRYGKLQIQRDTAPTILATEYKSPTIILIPHETR